MSAAPRVSVLMTTHNGAPLLGEALDSVLAQRFRDFELVVVDDASTDGATPALLDAYAARDARLRVLRPPRNLGVVEARNFGFAACRGAYVAAHDHDDLSHPDRLGAQVAHLDAHPEVVLLGTGAVLAREGRSRPTDYHAAGTPLMLRWTLHVDNPLTWSSVMFRAEAVRRLGVFLRPEYEYADDYDLYHRLLAVGEIARLDAMLTTYRWHARNTTHSRGDALFGNAVRVLAGAYRPWLGAAAEAAAALVIRHLSGREPVRDLATLERLGEVVERVLEGFCAAHALPPAGRTMVEAQAACLWWRLARGAARAGLPAALRRHRARPALCRAWRPPVGDVLASSLIGALRRHRATRPLVEALRWRGP
ncbi:glycosyltransferase family 2 protein [Crenalkalicoccus roseus]|uniref:glycosyltransferase family 2 protein n=1 Tax=Crenalkalicoccus roseus TaxID=1485588 RepID=UPI001081AAB4|nr:glycosyltransferase [Crenalkalicoccus roseus]